MKRQKSKSFSPGSFQADVRNKKGKSPYVFDKKLLPRLRQFLGEYGTGKLPSLDEAVHYLQGKYGEYGRRKKTVFKNSVQKVYQAIRNESAEEKKLQELEERFWGKRKHPEDFLPIDVESDEEGLVVSSDSECTDDETRAVLQNGNLVNKSMHDMYRTSSFRQNSDEENEESLDINIPIENTSNSSPRTLTLEVKNNGTATEEISVRERFLSTNGFSNNDSTRKTDLISTSGDVSRSDNVSRTNYSVSDSVPKNGILGYSPISVMAGSDLTVITADTLRSEHSFKEYNTPEIRNKRPADVSSQGSSAKERKKNRRSENTKKRKRNEEVLEDNTGNIPAVPSLRFSDLGGCSETIQEVCKLLIHIKHPEVFKALGITPPRGFLLHGPPGCGKTLLAHAIAGELEVPLINVASTEMVSGLSGESEGKIRDLFTRATVHTPCVLFLDEIDAITPKRETASKEMERRIVAQLLACLDDLNRNQEAQVVVIGATNRPDSLDPALRRAGRFDREIRMGIPDEQAREQILQVQCKDLKLSGEFDFKTIARQTPGFVGADLMALAREAAMCAVTRIFHCLEGETVSISSVDSVTNTNGHKAPGEMSTLNIMAWLKSNQVISEEKLTSLSIGMDDFTKALQDVQPSAKREGFATIPDVTWNDIGALEDIREELTMAIIAPVRHREAFTELGLTNPPGILLAGPPGCGKTLLAKAIANESGINFISVKGPELLNMYVGESERAVRQVFQRARNSAPCVIFFDELDALCPRRSDSSESNASARVVNQLLTEMDGLETRKQVFIMGATNRPDIIDPAILRPGRLDKVLYVGLPREKDRLAILQTITKRGTRPRLLEDVDLMAIASDEHSHGFSGADLAALVREASVNALRERMKLSTTKDSGMAWQPGSTNQDDSEAEAHGTSLGVASRHFDQAFTKIKPSVSEKEQVIYQYMKEQIRTDKPQ